VGNVRVALDPNGASLALERLGSSRAMF